MAAMSALRKHLFSRAGVSEELLVDSSASCGRDVLFLTSQAPTGKILSRQDKFDMLLRYTGGGERLARVIGFLSHYS